MNDLKGVMVPLVTPFTENGELDTASLRSLARHLIASGVHCLFPCGSTGEYFALQEEERKTVIEAVVAEAEGKVPVFAGTGAITTREAIRLTRMAESLGADGCVLITPYYISPSQDELYDHYAAVAASTKLTVIPYNNPARTGVTLLGPLVSRLSRIENLAGIKDSSGNIALTAEMINCTRPGFAVLQGQDAIIYPSLCIGASGCVVATGNVAAKEAVAVYEAWKAGDTARALSAQGRLAAVRASLALGTFPVPLKEAMAMQGLPGGYSRPPAKPLSEANRSELRALLVRIGLVKE